MAVVSYKCMLHVLASLPSVVLEVLTFPFTSTNIMVKIIIKEAGPKEFFCKIFEGTNFIAT